MNVPNHAEIDDAETQSAMAFLQALGRLDFEGATAYLDEDAVLDLPYAGSGHVIRGRHHVMTFFRDTMIGKVSNITYQLDFAYASREPGVIALEVSTEVESALSGTAFNRLVAIFRFRLGKIVLFREYFNPVPIAALPR